MRATIENHGNDSNLPPMEVSITKGNEDLTIKVFIKVFYIKVRNLLLVNGARYPPDYWFRFGQMTL